MKERLNIFMVFPEIVPFAKTSEMAEVGGSLPRVLKEMGHDVRLFTPQYQVTNERKYVLRDVIRLQNIDIPLGKKTIQINVKAAFLPDSKVQVYFIDYKPFFFRKGLYIESANGKPYKDNDKRFILFGKAVLETLKKLRWQPDVIHCHGWQSGLVPLFLATLYREDEFFKNTSTLFTIHNSELGELFPESCFTEMGLAEQVEELRQKVCFNGKCSYQKAGVVYSRKISAASQGVVDRLLETNGKKLTLADVLKKRGKDLFMIPPGAGSEIWNPETDKQILQRFSAGDLGGRQENKKEILKITGLEDKENRLLALVQHSEASSALTELIIKNIDALLAMNINLLFLGVSGEATKQLSGLIDKHKGRIGEIDVRDSNLNRAAFAGADFLFDYLYYPFCGMTIFRGMIYGVVPVIWVDALSKDLVTDVAVNRKSGEGFLIERLSKTALLKTVKSACELYKDGKGWTTVVKNCLRTRLSWKKIAEKYVKLYLDCCPASGSQKARG